MDKPTESREQEPSGGEGQGTPLTLQPDYGAAFPTFYANFASVSHTPDDLCVDFCLVAPPHNVNPEGNLLSTPVVARVVIPSGMGTGLIEALRAQLTKQSSERERGSMIISVRRKEADAHG